VTKSQETPHPGTILRDEYLEPNGMSVNKLAGALGLNVSRVNDIVRACRMATLAPIAGPMQALTAISLGILLVIGLLTHPAAIIALLFLGSLWISELSTSWIREPLVPVLACLGLAIGRAGRVWGVDAWLSQRSPSSRWC
jgi:uncharacterized membrane protein YphA (DoxX/SURF4 family)